MGATKEVCSAEEVVLGSGAGPAEGCGGAGPVEEAGLPKRWASRSSFTAPGAQSGCTAPEQLWADGYDTGGSVP